MSDFKSWIESPDRRYVWQKRILDMRDISSSTTRLSKAHRDHLQSVYNAHMLHSASADPFKLALYKLMGRLEPSRRAVPQVTTTTEDWLWFQLAMVMSSLNHTSQV